MGKLYQTPSQMLLQIFSHLSLYLLTTQLTTDGAQEETPSPSYNGNIPVQKDRPLGRRQLRRGKQQSFIDIIFSLPIPPPKKKTNHIDQELQWNTSQRHKQGNSCSKKPLEQLPRTAVTETSVHLKNRLSAARKGTKGRVKNSSGTNTTGKSHSSSPRTLS